MLLVRCRFVPSPITAVHTEPAARRALTRRIRPLSPVRNAAVATLLGLLAVLGAGCGDDATGPTTGTIAVTVATTGAEPDADGYTVSLGGGAGRPVPANGATEFAGVGAGDHTVALDGVAPNCAVTGEHPRRVRVAAGESATVAFSITCAATTGALEVTVTTTGSGTDADGYVVEVAGPNESRRVDVAADGTVTIPGLAPGQYSVRLRQVAIHCAVDDPHPRTVDVAAGATNAAVTIGVGCGPVGQLAFVRQEGGTLDIWVVGSDGGGETRLTTSPEWDAEPAWSPDGGQIAFASGRDGNAEIYVMRADGSSPRRLTSHLATDHAPAWSPDGRKIAFVSERAGPAGIYVMNADGTSPVRLTSGGQPAWSPDGTRIAFTSEWGIWVIGADGSAPTWLVGDATDPAFEPAWSPDGTMIAFQRHPVATGGCPYGDVVGADGSEVTGLPSGIGGEPAWSPDGRGIASVGMRDDVGCPSLGIQLVRADGTDLPIPLTSGDDFGPAWRP